MFQPANHLLRRGWPLGLALSLHTASGYGQQLPDVAQARQQLVAFEAACQREGGRTWGTSLYGPVLLVEPE